MPKTKAKSEPAPSPTKAGWTVAQWAADSGLSRAFVYNLMNAGAIRSVKAGSRRLVITAPAEYLARLAAEQEGDEEAAD